MRGRESTAGRGGTQSGSGTGGTTTLPPQELADLLHATLNGYDATLGVLTVALLPTGNCKSEGGSTVKVVPEGAEVWLSIAAESIGVLPASRA